MFTKRELKTFLESMYTDGRVVKLNFVSTENFFVAMKCKVDPDAGIPFFNEHFTEFIKKFSKFTSTTWIVRQTCPKVVRFVYRKVYACQLSSFNKKKVLQRLSKDRNKHCQAKIDFKVKRISRNTSKNDPYLREDLNLTITIQYEHTHLIRDREHFNLLRGSKESDSKVIAYFDSGFTALTAKAYHEMWLIEQHGNDAEILSNSNLNPTLNHMTYLFTRYRKDRETEVSVNSLMSDKKNNFENVGGTLIYTDNAEIALVITPFMKRVFSELSSDVVVVDSTRMNKLVLTYFYVPSKVGVLPIACAMHVSQDEDNFSQSFLTVKITIENIHFRRIFEPKILITNDSEEITKAAAAVFPQTKRVSLLVDVCRNFWAWMCDGENNVSRKRRHPQMITFRQMLYADSFEDSEKNYKDIMNNENTGANIKEYVNDVWSRRPEWNQSDVNEFLERHVLESSLIFVKELLLQRCKYFNVCMMVEVLVNVIDGHFCRILQMYAKGDESLATLTKFLRKEKDIVGFSSDSEKVSSKEYRRTSHLKTGRAFSFRTDTLCCTCNTGAKGHVCEHLCGIINAVDTDFKRLPCLNEQERVFFAKLSGIELEDLKNFKAEVPMTYEEGSDDKELEKDFSADDEDVDPDYQPDSSPKPGDDDSNDYYVLDVKAEQPERPDPLEELLMDATEGSDHQMVNESRKEIAAVEPELPPEEFKPKYEKALKVLNSEFRRLSKLFKENANKGNLATMMRLTVELAKIRPIERVNFKNLSVELNPEEGLSEKKIGADE